MFIACLKTAYAAVWNKIIKIAYLWRPVISAAVSTERENTGSTRIYESVGTIYAIEINCIIGRRFRTGLWHLKLHLCRTFF